MKERTREYWIIEERLIVKISFLEMVNQSKQEQSFGLVNLFFHPVPPFHLIIFGLKFIYFYACSHFLDSFYL